MVYLVLLELLDPRDQWDSVDHLDPLELKVARYDFDFVAMLC